LYFLKNCDIISTHLNRDVVLLNEKEFEQLGNGKIYVNTTIGCCYDVEALKTITNQEDNIQLKLILKEMMQNVESGEYIYNTMEKYPKVFPATYVNMIKMGELSKSEITSLEESLKYLLKENKRNEKISSAIKPKIIQLIGIIAIFIIGTITIIPCILY